MVLIDLGQFCKWFFKMLKISLRNKNIFECDDVYSSLFILNYLKPYLL